MRLDKQRARLLICEYTGPQLWQPTQERNHLRRVCDFGAGQKLSFSGSWSTLRSNRFFASWVSKGVQSSALVMVDTLTGKHWVSNSNLNVSPNVIHCAATWRTLVTRQKTIVVLHDFASSFSN